METVDILTWINGYLHQISLERWVTEDIFSLRWLSTLGFIIFSYVFCFSLLDKTRFVRTLLFGSLLSVFAVVLDIAAVSFNLFFYKSRLFPIRPAIFIYDITLLPLYYMILFQRALTWKSYTKWNIIAAAVIGFVFTPLMVKFDILQLIRWNYFYSFLTIVFLGFLAKAVTSFIVNVEETHKADLRQPSTSSVLTQPAFKPLANKDIEEDKP